MKTVRSHVFVSQGQGLVVSVCALLTLSTATQMKYYFIIQVKEEMAAAPVRERNV